MRRFAATTTIYRPTSTSREGTAERRPPARYRERYEHARMRSFPSDAAYVLAFYFFLVLLHRNFLLHASRRPPAFLFISCCTFPPKTDRRNLTPLLRYSLPGHLLPLLSTVPLSCSLESLARALVGMPLVRWRMSSFRPPKSDLPGAKDSLPDSASNFGPDELP